MMRCKMCNKVTQEKETTYKLTDYSPIWEMGRKKGVKILGEKPVCRMCYNEAPRHLKEILGWKKNGMYIENTIIKWMVLFDLVGFYPQLFIIRSDIHIRNNTIDIII